MSARLPRITVVGIGYLGRGHQVLAIKVDELPRTAYFTGRMTGLAGQGRRRPGMTHRHAR
jgi:hypothetical protein